MKPSKCLYVYLTDEKAEAQQEVVMCVPKVAQQLSSEADTWTMFLSLKPRVLSFTHTTWILSIQKCPCLMDIWKPYT